MEQRTTTGSERLDAVLSRLGQYRRVGRSYRARCPAHDDREPSLNVREGDDGKILIRCYAGCDFREIASALDVPMSEFFPDDANGSNGHHGNGQSRARDALTLAEFAAHTLLPREMLESAGLRDGIFFGSPCVEFDYRRRDGTSARTRIRLGLTGKRFAWKGSGGETVAYEVDGGRRALEQRYLVIVEGESDTLTLEHAGFPALGIPGADNTRVLQKEHLQGLDRIFYVREPDKGGETFAKRVPERLRELGFEGPIRELTMPAAAKDPSALYKRDPDAFPDVFRVLLSPPPRSKCLLDLIDSQVSDGIYFSTGFQRLDVELDDHGIPTGSLMVIVGGPGSRKTGLGTHFADHLSRLGAAVMFMACDESRKNVVTRLGQRAGFSRAGLRAKDDAGAATRAGLRRYEADLGRILRITELDDDDDAQTIEDAHAELVRAAGDRSRVLIIDSLQTVPCAAADALPVTAENQRLRVDAKLRVLKRLKRTGTLIVVISEVSRGFYNGSQKRIEKEHVLSAGKESGGIEFGVDLLLGLVRSKAAEDDIELVVAKCRIGREPRFWVRWDRDRARFDEVADPTSAEQRTDQDAARRAEIRQRIIEALLKHPGLSKTKLRAATRLERGLICEVVDELTLERVLVEGPKHAFRVSPQYGGKTDGESAE